MNALPLTLGQRVAWAREELLRRGDFEQLDRLDGLEMHSRGMEGEPEMDGLASPASLPSMSGFFGLSGTVGLALPVLMQLCGASVETGVMAGIAGGLLTMVGLVVAGPKVREMGLRRDVEKMTDEVLGLRVTPSPDRGLRDRLPDEQNRMVRNEMSRATRGSLASGALGGALAAWHLAPYGIFGGPFAFLTIPGVALMGASQGGDYGARQGSRSLRGCAVGTVLGALTFAAAAAPWGQPVAVGAAAVGSWVGGMIGYAVDPGRYSRSEILRNQLARTLGEPVLASHRERPALLSWLAEQNLDNLPKQVLSNRSRLVEALTERAERGEVTRESFPAVWGRLPGTVLESEVLTGRVDANLAVEKAIGPKATSRLLEETPERIRLGSISLKRRKP